MSRFYASALCSALLLILASGPPLAAADPPALESLFPQRMALRAEGGRLARSYLPRQVVAACRGDLSDLRLLDGRGREVAYIIDSGGPLESMIGKRVTVELTIQSVERSRREPENAPAFWQESYLLDLDPDEGSLPSPAGRAWDLVLTVGDTAGDREFVRTIRLESEAGEELASGSLFRLTNPLRERLRIPLPPFVSPILRVHIEGEDGSYLEPTFELESSIDIASQGSNEFDLELLSTRTSEGQTTVELDRPQGLIPDRLRVTTSTPAFSRTFEVWDEGPGSAAQPLAEQPLFRLRSQRLIEETELHLRPARGDRLRVVIDDGDSPPLEGLALTAVLRRPAILFVLPADPEGEATATLYFGGGRAHRPRYDVAALLPVLPTSDLPGTLVGRMADQMYDPAKLAKVSFEAAEPNPRFDPTPALSFAMHAGRQLDAASFTHRRQLTAPTSADGLVRHQLAIDTIARARPDLGDIRIVDAESRQWPYLIERGTHFKTLKLQIEEHELEESKSIYTLTLPASPMVVDEIVIDPPASFFERTFELEGSDPEDPGSWLRLADGPLRRRQGDRRKVHIPAAGRRVASLRLTIEDNDNAPLDLGTVELRYAATELFFAAPAGDYTLLVGDPQAEAPHYELEAVRAVVLAVGAIEATAGPLGENPAYSTLARLSTTRGLQQAALWSVLALAVLILGWFTFRLSQGQTSEDE